MSSGRNFTHHISERLQIGTVKVAYPFSNKGTYTQHMLTHNNWYTVLDYIEKTLSHLALQAWCDIDSAKVFNLLAAVDKWRNTHRTHLECLQHCQEETFFPHISQLVHHLREPMSAECAQVSN